MSCVAYQSAGLDDLELFVAVVSAGGFTAASRAIGVRKALLSRRVQELEDRLGARLLERTTRTIRLTEVGAAFHEQAAQAVASAHAAVQTAKAALREPSGLLRISATQLLADLLLEPVITVYLQRHPKVAIELDVGSRTVDVVRESFDIALRVGPPKDTSLQGRLLGTGRTIYVASAQYLARRGHPQKPGELAEHDAVAIAGGPLEWPFEHRGRKQWVKPQVRLLTPSYALARQAAVAGLGIARLPSFYLAAALRTGALQAILTEWTPAEAPIFALFAQRLHLAPKTRAFLDLLTEHLHDNPLPTAD